MFAVAARYDQSEAPPDSGNLWEAGLNYMVEAREVLSTLLCIYSWVHPTYFLFQTVSITIPEEPRVRPCCC
jgi:hypothetical protein